MVKAGLGIAGLIIIIFSTVTTTFLDAYSAGVSSESVFPKLKGRHVGIVVTVIGTAAAILFPMDDITDFLYLIGSVFAPMIAVQITDTFILKKDSGWSSFNWKNLIIWLIGFILYRWLMTVDIPVGNTLPDMLAVILICVIADKIILQKNSCQISAGLRWCNWTLHDFLKCNIKNACDDTAFFL